MKQSKTLTVAATVMLLQACSLDSLFSDDKKDVVEVDNIAKVSDIEQIKVNQSALVRSSAALTERVLKNGMVLQAENYGCWMCFEDNVEAVTDAGAPKSDDNYSQTTTQEAGVDESDRVKYDGDRVYIASNHYYSYYTARSDSSNSNDKPHVRILEKNSDDSLTEATSIYLADNALNVNDLYVNDDKLMAIYNVYADTSANQVSTMPTDIWFPYKQQFGLTLANVTDTDNVVVDAEYVIDGYPISSRRIGNKVYLLSTYSNDVSFLYLDGSAEISQARYTELLANKDIQVLPKIYANGSSEQLVSGEDCYLPAGSDVEAAYSSVATLTTFDLDNPGEINSVCVITPTNGVYASTDSIYLYHSGHSFDDDKQQWRPSTSVNKFTYTADSIEYEASGVLDGDLGWSNTHLRFSEHDGDLRVVTTDRFNSDGPEHSLYVLRPDANGNLATIAQLPNETQPEKIGKPGEDVYAVRYFGDTAYIVTFERRDPLYVVDLSNPDAPKLAGELDIPGYSAYLHPLNENFIVGIGMQVDPNLNTANEDPNFVSGAKIELYDVSNPNSPVVAETLVYENGTSVVEWDYHALTVLQTSSDQFQFAFPVSAWQTTNETDGSQQWNYQNSLKLVDVSLQQGGAMTQVGELNVGGDYFGSWGDRSIIHNDVIYYIHNNSVWQSYWSMPNVVNGPY